MGILSNSIFQFIITTSLTLLLGGISVWFAIRRPVQIPLTYETLVQQRVNPSNEEVRDLLAAIHISPDDSRVQYLSFVTFKLWNSGKESVTLTDDKPIYITFNRGATILACQEIETAPQDLEYTCQLEDEKILLAFPLLDPKDSTTFRILIPERVYDFPDISIRVPGSKHIVRANNIRHSKELFILGIIFFCVTTYLFVSTWSLSPSPFSAETWAMFYGAGILFLITSWLVRSLPPDPSLSERLWMTIKSIPLAIPIFTLFLLIDHWFGKQGVIYFMTVFICIATPFIFGVILYTCITTLLKKIGIKYNAVLVGVLISIPSLAILASCIWVFFLYR